MAFGLSAGTLVSLGGAALGAYSANKNSKAAAAAASQQGQLDPRVQAILFGSSDGNGPQAGLLQKYQDLMTQPQNAQLQQYGKTAQDYLGTNGQADFDAIRNAAGGLLAPNSPALAGIPAYAVGNKVQAPSQNGIDLTGAYNSLLSGGDTSKLMSSLQAGNALTTAQLQQNQANLTDNLQRNVLPSIRSNSVLAGQYGGSRQGIAEGNAISDFTRQLNDSATQIGLANSANTASQLANAYENGQQRKLAATQGLGAQQYGVASQNANTANQAEFMNVGNSYDASKFNASTTNQVNQSNGNSSAVGAGLLSGLMGQAYGIGNAQNNYDLTRAQGVNGLLQPYLTGVPTQNPQYSNSTASALGGGLQGLQLGSQLAGLFA